MSVTVRAVAPADADQWRDLYSAYREFYALEPDADVVDRVWAWIGDAGHETNALVAVDEHGTLAGLAHYRRFARPSSGTTGLWLDDLFTRPDLRGAGVGRALIDAVARIADAEKLSVVRWITNENNATARRLYDTMATATKWVTYDRVPGA
ncbi:GNAT family N-acetyltransferase [Conyzicola nivalis]|uniref:N-acetyltransferase n=1 Tax=Conyzicola nivalis TaxID=1477021 RepID=A0A916SD00_9MICO|nr:GNAT family N-acetyltransferase [Conyzicola nivalis]GGA91660.1 N-acetyltransferase [Conyzicola nivalis]